MRCFSAIFLLLVSCALLRAADQKITIRLHQEGTEQEGASFVKPVTLINPPKKTFIRMVPVMTEKDIVEFYPFTAPDNSGSFGAYFILNPDGAARMEQHTASQRDTMLIALINGRIATALMVDKKITNGIITIPTGFLTSEIVQLEALYPTRGKEKEFAEQKKKATEMLKAAQKKAKEVAKENKKKPSS